ncbi:hypothetical protein Tco_0498766 [Tanacetum coccineum]
MGRGELVVVLGRWFGKKNHGKGRFDFGGYGVSSGSGLTADSSVLTLTLTFLDFGLDFAQSYPGERRVGREAADDGKHANKHREIVSVKEEEADPRAGVRAGVTRV